jgi:hypothetical protein
MTQPVTDDTFVDLPDSQQGLPPNPLSQPPAPVPPQPPSPADAPPQRPQPNAPQNSPGDDTDDGDEGGLKTVEDYQKALKKARKEAADRRVKIRELEPLANKAREAEEANKTELERERERADAAEARDREREEQFTRTDIAYTQGILPENIDLIGSGSREEMEARAVRVRAMQDQQQPSSAPPTDRPVEGLRPGASPEPPRPADDSYPAAWIPNSVRDGERTLYGQ